MRFSPAGAPSRRREKKAQEARLQQHPVRLISGKILRHADEGKKDGEADQQHRARPNIYGQQQRRNHAGNANCQQHAVACRPPQDRRRKPESPSAQLLGHRGEVILRGKNSPGTNQSANLKQQRIKDGKKNQSKTAQENPSCGQVAGLFPAIGSEQASRQRRELKIHDEPLYKNISSP